MDELIWNSPNINAWVKDRHGHYIKCSEGFAEHAGISSPSSIVGMDDTQLIWRDNIKKIRRGDVMARSGLPIINAHHTLQTKYGVSSILVNKHVANDVIIGSAIDITGRVLMTQKGRWDLDQKIFSINEIKLTIKEVDVVRLLLLGQSVKLIAARLDVHSKTVEQRIESLRKKFGASNKINLVQTLHQSGLEYLAHNIDKNIIL